LLSLKGKESKGKPKEEATRQEQSSIVSVIKTVFSLARDVSLLFTR
jgi:hypothetical protein